MATEIVMPRQGNTVESCLILEWRKHEGDDIKAGEVICEVETDKATFEIESEVEGTLLKVFFEEGADVPVLTPIAIIGQPGEDIPDSVPEQPVAEQPVLKSPEEPPMDKAEVSPDIQTEVFPGHPSGSTTDVLGVSPRARNLAAAKGLDLFGVFGTGPHGRIIERDVLAALADKAPLTPAAIAALVEQGMQPPTRGSGIGGRVTTADLIEQPPSPPPVEPIEEFLGPSREVPVKGIRKIIASRMLESLQSTAQLTMNISADATQLMAYRKRLKTSPEKLELSGITITDLLLYAVATTLPRFKALNAHFLGETIKEFEHVHLGLAVDIPRGLMVPVVRSADTLSLKALSQEAKRLTTACQESTILPDELSGGTFTITNLGALGIESFTPVLNPPEVAILGICAIQPKPVMSADNVTFVPHIGLSLTFDHRAVDGAPAARFLKELATALANFDLLLAG